MSSPERISVERLKERGSTWFLVSRLLYVWCLPLLLVLTAAIGLTACQGGEPEENTAGAPTIQLKADPSGAPKFLRQLFFAKPGKVTIGFRNESSVGHNMTIVGPVDRDPMSVPFEPIMRPDTETVATETITNSSTSIEVDLEKPDEDQGAAYYFYCSVDGHEAAGMKGVIIVND